MSKESYEARFIVQRPERYGEFSKVVYVLPSVIHQAKLVLSSSFKEGVTVQSYINNILIDHFKRYKKDIDELNAEFFRWFNETYGKEVCE